MASYDLAPVLPIVPITVYGGFQHIVYMNPSIALAPGFDDINGYVLGAVNNAAYAKNDKQLNVYWLGARYAVTPQLTAAIAYYGERAVRSSATGANAGLLSAVSGSCSGNSPRWPPCVARLPLHEALRHLRRGAMCVERVAWPRQRVPEHEHDRPDHRRALLVLTLFSSHPIGRSIDRPIESGVSWPLRGHEIPGCS